MKVGFMDKVMTVMFNLCLAHLFLILKVHFWSYMAVFWILREALTNFMALISAPQ